MAMINVSRHVNTIKLPLKVKVLTPMFLGGADQNAELRSAPFKAALRYWWRIAKGGMDTDQLLHEETELFGGVSESPLKSRVSVSIKGDVNIIIPKSGKQKKIAHPEAEKAKHKVDGPGYLAGMGHYDFKKGFKKKAIAAGQVFELLVQYPSEHSKIIENALWLLNRFGSIGARSRNGFGSFYFENFNDRDMNCLSVVNFKVALRKDMNPYPHCLTGDELGLTLWKLPGTNQYDYDSLMRDLAELYIRLRTIPFFKFKNAGPGNRHLLGYPIMNHSIKEWGGNGGRLPSQLRLMVKPDGKDRLNGFILHLAHSLPDDKRWFPNLSSQEEIWKEVHGFLDKEMTRVTL